MLKVIAFSVSFKQMDQAFFAESGRSEFKKSLGKLTVISRTLSVGWAKWSPFSSKETTKLSSQLLDYFSSLSTSFFDLKVHINHSDYDNFLLSLRLLLYKEFNRKIPGISQGKLSSITPDDIQESLKSFNDAPKMIEFFTTLPDQYKFVFDMGMNLTDLSYFNIPENVRPYLTKLSKYKGKQASFLVALVMKQIEMTLKRPLSNEQLQSIWDTCHDLAVLRLAQHQFPADLGLSEDMYKKYFQERGILNFSGMIQLLSKCSDLEFCEQLLCNSFSLDMAIYQSDESHISSLDWLKFKMKTYFQNLASNNATDNMFLPQLADMEGVQLNAELKVSSIVRYPLVLVVHSIVKED